MQVLQARGRERDRQHKKERREAASVAAGIAAVAALAHVVGSTTQLISAVGKLPTDRFIVATDQGILHDMQKRYPDKHFMPAPTAGQGATC